MSKRATGRVTTPVIKHAVITGLTPIMFDRYAGDNATVLDPAQKYYTDPDTGHLVLPTLNLMSFLAAENTDSAPKVCLDSRTYKRIASALLSSVVIAPSPHIPFLRDGQPITPGPFNAEGADPQSGMRVMYHVARLPKGIPNPKARPVLPTPWSLEFDIRISPHPDLTIDLIENLFIDGGARLGLGTFRRVFGKFAFEWTDATDD